MQHLTGSIFMKAHNVQKDILPRNVRFHLLFFPLLLLSVGILVNLQNLFCERSRGIVAIKDVPSNPDQVKCALPSHAF